MSNPLPAGVVAKLRELVNKAPIWCNRPALVDINELAETACRIGRESAFEESAGRIGELHAAILALRDEWCAAKERP